MKTRQDTDVCTVDKVVRPTPVLISNLFFSKKKKKKNASLTNYKDINTKF